MNPDTVQGRDLRRALALLSHHLDHNHAGVTAVLEDAAEDHRAAHALVTVLDLWVRTAPWLATPRGRQWIAENTAEAARLDADGR